MSVNLEEFVHARGPTLLRTAMLLCGGDRHRAEDLLQDALVRCSRHWRRIDDPESYVRRALAHAAVDAWRRPKREVLTAELPERPAAEIDGHEDVLAVLGQLPSRQRVALVLRYLHDLSIEQTAQDMGCSTGTVKTHCSRGLAALRQQLADRELSS